MGEKKIAVDEEIPRAIVLVFIVNCQKWLT